MTARYGKGTDSDATDTMVVSALTASHGGPDDNDAQAGHLIPFDTTQITSGENRSNPQPGDPCHPLAAKGHAPAIACVTGDRTHALTSEGADASEDGTGRGTPIIAGQTAVRRLTPLECERLQGWPDNHTLTSNGRPQSDSARYKQAGNGVARPVFTWVIAGIAGAA